MHNSYPDLLCFSHLRWNFVYQRPQHLMKRFSKQGRVFFIEEPVVDAEDDHIEITRENATEDNVNVLLRIVFHLTAGLSPQEMINSQQQLLDKVMNQYGINRYYTWYYSPLALDIGIHLHPLLVIYDCMDELSAFKFAPPYIKIKEAELLQQADIVFTGGTSLYNAKKNLHNNVYAFPSSIDKQHFAKARLTYIEPEDQKKIAGPKLGFYGVLDERLNLNLIEEMASLRSEWQFIFVGPVVKIDPLSLPKRVNIHYIGSRSYEELPAYLAGWDICIMPFALNESTEFISPTKTPEFLCGGKPVISTSIRDVIDPYGKQGLVHIADTAEEFIQKAEVELNITDKMHWLKRVDSYLRWMSWDRTFDRMNNIIIKTAFMKQNFKSSKKEIYV